MARRNRTTRHAGPTYEIQARPTLDNGEVAQGKTALIAVWRDDMDNECFFSIRTADAARLIKKGEAVATLAADVILEGL